VMECPPTVFAGIGAVCKEWNVDFTDPVKGYDFIILRSQGSGGFTKYDVKPATKQVEMSKTLDLSPLSEVELKLLVESFPDLDALIALPDASSTARVWAAIQPFLGEPKVTPAAQPFVPINYTQPLPLQPLQPLPLQPLQPAVAVNDQCPYYGTDYNATDEACRECNLAEPCRTATVASKAPAETPTRVSVK